MKITAVPDNADMVELRAKEPELLKAAEVIGGFKVRPRIIPKLNANGVMKISCLAEGSADEVHLLSATKYGAKTFIDDKEPTCGDFFFIVPKGDANRVNKALGKWQKQEKKEEKSSEPEQPQKKSKKKRG